MRSIGYSLHHEDRTADSAEAIAGPPNGNCDEVGTKMGLGDVMAVTRCREAPPVLFSVICDFSFTL